MDRDEDTGRRVHSLIEEVARRKMDSSRVGEAGKNQVGATRYVLRNIVLGSLAAILLMAAILAVIGEDWFLSLLLQVPGLGSRTQDLLGSSGLSLTDLAGRLSLVGLVVLGTLATIFHFRPNALRQFFLAPADPLNLAMFRVVFFLSLAASPVLGEAWSLSSASPALIRAPAGLSGVQDLIPLVGMPVRIGIILFVICCLLAAAGWRVGYSATAATILGVYVLGAPQFFGKVNHYHHMVWFAAILAASRCADVLSVDAVRKVRQGAASASRPLPAIKYGLPLRFVWLLIGILYFFPGFWKLVRGGPTWIFGDNMKFIFYDRWFNLGEFSPIFPITDYPLLYRAAAGSAVVFELLFIVLLLIPVARTYLAALGLFFHNMNGLFLRLPFYSLQVAYVSFVNWRSVGLWLGSHMFPRGLDVRYGGGCAECEKIVAVSNRLDIFGRTEFTPLTSVPTYRQTSLCHLEALSEGKDLSGAQLSRALIRRNPGLFFVLRSLYSDLEHSAGLPPRAHVRTLSDAEAASDSWRSRPVVAVGGGLLALSFITGLAGVGKAWPIAAYPQFSQLADDTKETVTVEIVRDGRDAGSLERSQRVLSGSRFEGLLGAVVAAPDLTTRERRLDAFTRFWTVNGTLQKGDDLVFYRDTVTTLPTRGGSNPLARQMLFRNSDYD